MTWESGSYRRERHRADVVVAREVLRLLDHGR